MPAAYHWLKRELDETHTEVHAEHADAEEYEDSCSPTSRVHVTFAPNHRIYSHILWMGLVVHCPSKFSTLWFVHEYEGHYEVDDAKQPAHREVQGVLVEVPGRCPYL
eukprot:scaffold1318_cov388-Prasinococcus_capsulatus_cf.AAC.15